MFAVIESGGKQYVVSEGDQIQIENIGSSVDETVSFDNVLLIADGKKTKIGKPFLEGAKVTGKVQEISKLDKIIVFKFKRKTGYKRKQGHRQEQTTIKIDSIVDKLQAKEKKSSKSVSVEDNSKNMDKTTSKFAKKVSTTK